MGYISPGTHGHVFKAEFGGRDAIASARRFSQPGGKPLSLADGENENPGGHPTRFDTPTTTCAFAGIRATASCVLWSTTTTARLVVLITVTPLVSVPTCTVPSVPGSIVTMLVVVVVTMTVLGSVVGTSTTVEGSTCCDPSTNSAWSGSMIASCQPVRSCSGSGSQIGSGGRPSCA